MSGSFTEQRYLSFALFDKVPTSRAYYRNDRSSVVACREDFMTSSSGGLLGSRSLESFRVGFAYPTQVISLRRPRGTHYLHERSACRRASEEHVRP